jgi:hypothetical protein
MVADADPRLLRAIRQLDQAQTAQKKAEQQVRALQLANTKLRRAVVYWRDHKPASAKPAPS